MQTGTRKKRKIGLVGYFGWGNFGDELFLAAHRQHLGDDYELEVIHDILGEPYFSKPIEEMIEPYDGILIGGGDLINPVRVSGLYWQEAFLKRPVFVYGIGVPNVKWLRQNIVDVYRRFFQHPNCKLVVPRDVESYNWIKANIAPTGHFEWYPDPVCSLRFPPATPSKEKTLGVVIRSHRSLSDDLSAVREMIDKAKDMGYSVKHLALANLQLGEADLQMAQSIAGEGEEIVVSDSLETLCQAISSCSLLASIKFHGMVVATMYGVPTIAMSVTPKNRNFLRMIERPEMLRGYTDSDLWKNLSYYPAVIPKPVRDWLFVRSTEGYEVLRSKIREALEPAGTAPATPRGDGEPAQAPGTAMVSSGQWESPGGVHDSTALGQRTVARITELPRRLGVDRTALRGARILEVGCGNGECTAAAMQLLDADAYGVDTEPRWIGGLYEKLGSEGRLWQVDRTRLDVEGAQPFDFVHSYSVLGQVEKPRTVLENVFRVLSPGGRAFLSFNLYFGASASHLLGYLPDMPWIHLTHTEDEARAIVKRRFGVDRGFECGNKWTYQDYLDACEEIGFRIEKCWYMKKEPEPGFYEAHKASLGRFSIADLSKNVMNVTLVRPG